MIIRRRVPLLLLLFWAIPAAFAVVGFQIVPSARNPGISFVALALSQLLMWFSWGIWSILIIAVSERVPFERGQLTRAVLVHLPMCVLVICGQILVTSFISRQFDLSAPHALLSTMALGFRQYGDLFVVIYGAIVGAHAAFRWYGAFQAQGLVAAQLERDLGAAQLSALRSQLNPHFLFNALNSVVTLIPRDQEGATRMVVRLADLLRATLGMAEEQQIDLSRELEMVRNYLDIELVRFPDRLVVDWDVDAAVRQAQVPAFVLQPLVENAIIHGVSRRSGAGRITIAARAAGLMLSLSVTDTGPGLHAPTLSRSTARGTGAGIGLANLRARLERLYPGEQAEVALSAAASGGVLATLTLPLRLAPLALKPEVRSSAA